MLQVAQQISPTTTTIGTNGTTLNGKKHTSRSLHVVEEIRKRFFEEEWPANKELYHENDIEKIRESEWFIKRFLLVCSRNPQEAFEMLKETLAWRKRVELHTAQPNFFPKEFYQIGGLFSYECDRENNPVIYLRIRMHRKIKEIQEPVQQFLFYTIFRVDQETDSKGAVIVFDCSGAGYSNMDIDMLRTFSEVSYKYFPYCFKYVIVYELHWMLNAFRRIAMSVIPSGFVSLIRFANKDDITNYIAPENLPDFMGGTCRQNYRIVPDGCRSVEEVAQERGFDEEEIKRIRPMFEPYLSEGIEAIAKREQEDRQEEEKKERPSQIMRHDTSSTTAAEVSEVQPRPTTMVSDEGDFDDAASSSSSIAVIRACSRPFAQYASIFPPNNVLFRTITSNDSRWSQFVRKTRSTSTPNAASSQTRCQLLVGLIMIRNNHQSIPLAFKIQSTNSERYIVTPNQGILLSGAFVSIQVTVLQKNSNNLSDKLYEKISMDKFLVLMLPDVGSGGSIQHQLQGEEESKEFNNLFVKHMDKVYSHKLRVQMPINAVARLSSNAESTTTDEQDGNALNDSSANSDKHSVIQLKNELQQLKVKYRMLESRQRWINLTILVMLLVILLAIILGVSLFSCRIPEEPSLSHSISLESNLKSSISHLLNNDSPAANSPIHTISKKMNSEL